MGPQHLLIGKPKLIDLWPAVIAAGDFAMAAVKCGCLPPVCGFIVLLSSNNTCESQRKSEKHTLQRQLKLFYPEPIEKAKFGYSGFGKNIYCSRQKEVRQAESI